MTASKDNGLTLSLTMVRTSYLYVFKPYQNENNEGEPKYTGHFLMGPDHPDVPKVVAAMKAACVGTFGDKAMEMYESFKGKHTLCLRDGTINKPGEDHYKGKLFLSANNAKRPLVVDGQKNILNSGDALAPYSGCWVNARINIWAQNNKWGKRVNASLLGVQFVKHDEAFSGGRVATVDEFGIVADDADGAAPQSSAAGLF